MNVRAKERALKRNFNRKEKVNIDGGMVAECQELHDEEAATALKMEEENIRVVIGVDP